MLRRWLALLLLATLVLTSGCHYCRKCYWRAAAYYNTFGPGGPPGPCGPVCPPVCATVCTPPVPAPPCPCPPPFPY